MNSTSAVDKLIVQALIASEAFFKNNNAGECLDDALQVASSVKDWRPRIFAVTGLTAISRYLEIEDDTPFKVLVRVSAPLKGGSSSSIAYSFGSFMEIFKASLKKIIKKSKEEIIGFEFQISKLPKNEFSVAFKLNGVQFKQKKIIFQEWQENFSIHQALREEIFSVDKLVLNLKNYELLKSENDQFKAIKNYESIELDVQTNLFSLDSDDSNAAHSLETLEFVNKIAALTDKIKIVKTESFRNYCKEAIAKHLKKKELWSQVRGGLELVARSDSWRKCFVDLINWKIFSISFSTFLTWNNQTFFKPIPFRPQRTKMLLERSSHVLDFQSQAESINLVSDFLDISGLRLLALAAAMVGDLMEFSESKSVFCNLICCFFEEEKARQIIEQLDIGHLDSTTNKVISKVSGVAILDFFIQTNSGNEFKNEKFPTGKDDDLELLVRPSEDSYLMNFRNLEESFISESLQLSGQQALKCSYSRVIPDSLTTSHICSNSTQ